MNTKEAAFSRRVGAHRLGEAQGQKESEEHATKARTRRLEPWRIFCAPAVLSAVLLVAGVAMPMHGAEQKPNILYIA